MIRKDCSELLRPADGFQESPGLACIVALRLALVGGGLFKDATPCGPDCDYPPMPVTLNEDSNSKVDPPAPKPGRGPQTLPWEPSTFWQANVVLATE